jgi:hypothetical protein
MVFVFLMKKEEIHGRNQKIKTILILKLKMDVEELATLIESIMLNRK